MTSRSAVGLVAGIAAMFLQGCGTIINGSNQKVPISTDPPGAHVQVAGGEAATTPCELNLSRKNSHTITISLEGYQSEQVTLQSTLSGAMAGNLLLGGIVGGGVDLVSGGGYKLIPNSVNIRLRPE